MLRFNEKLYPDMTGGSGTLPRGSAVPPTDENSIAQACFRFQGPHSSHFLALTDHTSEWHDISASKFQGSYIHIQSGSRAVGVETARGPDSPDSPTFFHPIPMRNVLIIEIQRPRGTSKKPTGRCSRLFIEQTFSNLLLIIAPRLQQRIPLDLCSQVPLLPPL